MLKKIFTLCLISLLFGCQKYGLLIRQQKVDAGYLASTHIGSPDPSQANPPSGELVIVEWWVPRELLEKQPKVILRLIYWNYTEEIIEFPITKRVGYDVFPIYQEKFNETGGILTYMAEIVDNCGEVFQEWKHQLWVNLIQVKDDEVIEEAKQSSID